MSEVIDLSSYMRQTNAGQGTSAPSSEPDWARYETNSPIGNLDASALRKLDPESELAKFLNLSEDLIVRLESSSEALREKDNLLADDHLIAAKKLASELLMYRNLSDAIGIVALKIFQALCEIKSVVESPGSVDVMKQSLQRIWAAPFMAFDDAADLASAIEDSVGGLKLVGYDEIAGELIGDAFVADHA